MKVIATYSPCCKVLRAGVHEPGVMHSGACPDKRDGELGPTLLLVDLAEVQRLAWDNRGKFASDDACYAFIECLSLYR